MVNLEGLVPPDDQLLVIVGPTASGKTDLAIELAEQLGGEIISADSVQVYRYFDIGTGKPSPTQRQRATHHMVGTVDPLNPFDAARFVDRAEHALKDIRKRGRYPIVCGGSYLWIKALTFGLAAAPPADATIRERHRRVAEKKGGPAELHRQLAQVDPESGTRLNQNDITRVSRALEVFELSGKTQTEWHAQHQFKTTRHRHKLVGIELDRDTLDQRIAQRAEAWLAQGWIEEVKELKVRGYGQARAMRSVGYRQIHEFLNGELDRAELSEAIVRATRTFVRRQRTWLRDQPVQWVPR